MNGVLLIFLKKRNEKQENMKYFIGFFITLLILAGGTLGVLAIWDIYPVSWTLIWKVLLTILAVSVILTLVAMSFATFFKKERYDKTGNNAHPMK